MHINNYTIAIVIYIITCSHNVRSQTSCMDGLTNVDSNTRYTHRSNKPITVLRYGLDAGFIHKVKEDEANFLKLYTKSDPTVSSKLMVSYAAYNLSANHTRNCHDYAFGSYMVDNFENTVAGSQKEAWWMCDPSQNWHDNSLSVGVTSSAYIVDNAVYTHVNNLSDIGEYLFNTSQLNALQSQYVDAFWDMIDLPVCVLDDVNYITPTAHSALLVDWLTPSNVDPQYSAGVFVSKWGMGGIWRHRFAKGCCPDEYFTAFHLMVFVPNGTGWPYNSPPYIIYPSPWGLFN